MAVCGVSARHRTGRCGMDVVLAVTLVPNAEAVLAYFFVSSRRRHTRFGCDWSSDVCSSDLGTASSALLAGVIGFAGIASFQGATPAQRRGHVAVFANSLAWTFAATDWVKVIVRRKRPVLYTAGGTAAAGDPNSQRSFPSGHASVAFATATTYLMMARRERLPHRGRNAALLYVGALGVSALRVSAGKHFPTDVLGGAVLGTRLRRPGGKGRPTER